MMGLKHCALLTHFNFGLVDPKSFHPDPNLPTYFRPTNQHQRQQQHPNQHQHYYYHHSHQTYVHQHQLHNAQNQQTDPKSHPIRDAIYQTTYSHLSVWSQTPNNEPQKQMIPLLPRHVGVFRYNAVNQPFVYQRAVTKCPCPLVVGNHYAPPPQYHVAIPS